MDPIQLMEQRQAAIVQRLEAIASAAETEARAVSDDEQTEHTALMAEHRSLTEKIAGQREAAELRAAQGAALGAANPGAGPIHTELRSEPYARGGKESYFKDLYQARHKGDRSAQQRLDVNDKHREERLAKHEKLELRAMSTAAGAGGEFAPPLWQVEDFVAYRRPGRPTAATLNHEVLPAGVSTINLPKVTTGALTGAQSGQNTQVANRDFATGSVSSGINTVAGRVIISQQELDQTPINLDSIILADLQRDYDMQIDLAAINGITAVAGLNGITYTDASPTSAKVLAQVQAGIDAVHLGLFSPPRVIIMRPDRWGRFLSATDAQGRPLVLPVAEYGAFNAQGLGDGIVSQGVVGTLRGVPVIVDASIPNNLGTGTNQDEILILDPSQINLYESAPKAETFQQTYADQLSVLIRFYSYYSLLANRLPKAIAVVTGTGMIPGSYGA